VKVRYDEGVATHIGPEPCVAVRKDVDEASVGEGTSQPLSHEIRISGCRLCFESEEQARDRVLSDDELRWLWQACGTSDGRSAHWCVWIGVRPWLARDPAVG